MTEPQLPRQARIELAATEAASRVMHIAARNSLAYDTTMAVLAVAQPMIETTAQFMECSRLTWLVAEYLDQHPDASGDQIHRLLSDELKKSVEAL